MADGFALGEGPDACLLLHGLTGTPAEVRPVGEALARAGFRVLAPLLPGHGTKPEDLYTTTRFDLLRAAEGALSSLSGRLYVCGLSMGSLLALHLAARPLPEIAGLALLAPAIEFNGASWLFVNLFGRLPALPFIVGKSRDFPGDGAYEAVPLRWGEELRALSTSALQLAHHVRAPALVLHGARDNTTSPAGSRKLLNELASPQKELHILPRSRHLLPLDVESDAVCNAVVQFFEGVRHGEVRPRD